MEFYMQLLGWFTTNKQLSTVYMFLQQHSRKRKQTC